ncbi:UNVERIFIED_CONTAM: hypothetical protein K2H54_016487 [Gekko kuhli]
MKASLTNTNDTHTSGSRSSKTFKPKKNIPEGSHQYELLKHAEATLGSGNLRMAVMLPEGEDLNEWVAVNTISLYYNFSSWEKCQDCFFGKHRKPDNNLADDDSFRFQLQQLCCADMPSPHLN